METGNFETPPTSESVRLIDFEESKVVPGFVNGTWILIVKGHAPCLNMEVSLTPRIYAKCPEYWGIEVIGATNSAKHDVTGGCSNHDDS